MDITDQGKAALASSGVILVRCGWSVGHYRFLFFVRAVYSRRFMAVQHNQLASSGRVLIVRPTALGDVCRTVPALVTLRRAFPDARIDWLVHEGFTEAIEHHPALDGVIGFPRKRFSRLLTHPQHWRAFGRWLGQLKRNRYDLVVDLQGLARSGFFSWWTGAQTRIGFANAREGAWLGYTQRYEVDRKLHTVDRMLGLLEAAGFEVVRDMSLYVSERDRQWAGSYLKERGLLDRPFVCLAPTAQWLCKCWPLDRFEQIGGRLQKEKNWGVVVLGAPSEQAQIQPLLDGLGVDLPSTTVGQLMALVEACSLLVCNDSGPLHMGVGLNKPIVSLFGPTDPAVVGPYQRSESVVAVADAQDVSYRVRKDDQTLIGQISVESVWDKIQAVLPSS